MATTYTLNSDDFTSSVISNLAQELAMSLQRSMVSPLSRGVMDRAQGVLLGLAVGDALGGPVEFLTPAEIRARHSGRLDDYVGGGWLSLLPGQGTDDTGMALALARSAATSVGYVPRRALTAYLEWFRGDPADVGKSIRAALEGVEAGMPSAAATEAFHRRIGQIVLETRRNAIGPLSGSH